MPRVLAFDDIKPERVRRARGGPGSPNSLIHEFFKPSPENPDGPSVTFARYDPGVKSSAHFHTVDQYQILVAGKGIFGRHGVAPYYVHFSRAYTPYGPLLSDPEEGWCFMTFRTHYDPGAQRFPASRDKLKQIADRRPWQITANVAFPDAGAGAALQYASGIKDEQGLYTCGLAMAPDTRTRIPDPSGGDGQYVVVTTGSMLDGGREHKALAVVFVRPDESAFEIHAGPQGLTAIVLNFPRVTRRPLEIIAPSAAGVKKWQCALCSFAYDEALGMPEDGVAAGTRWGDVPETWSCPDCGAAKADFEMVEV